MSLVLYVASEQAVRVYLFTWKEKICGMRFGPKRSSDEQASVSCRFANDTV